MKKIPLTKGYFAIVDDADYLCLMKWKWCARTSRDGKVYAVRYAGKNFEGKQVFVYMHRFLNGTPPHLKTDHRDRNTLNNQRKNLRSATSTQNAMNSIGHRDAVSKFKGVARNSKWVPGGKNPWIAHFKNRHLGVFPTEESAHAAYIIASKKEFGEFQSKETIRA